MEKNGPDHDHVKLVWGFRFSRMYFFLLLLLIFWDVGGMGVGVGEGI